MYSHYSSFPKLRRSNSKTWLSQRTPMQNHAQYNRRVRRRLNESNGGSTFYPSDPNHLRHPRDMSYSSNFSDSRVHHRPRRTVSHLSPHPPPRRYSRHEYPSNGSRQRLDMNFEALEKFFHTQNKDNNNNQIFQNIQQEENKNINNAFRNTIRKEVEKHFTPKLYKYIAKEVRASYSASLQSIVRNEVKAVTSSKIESIITSELMKCIKSDLQQNLESEIQSCIEKQVKSQLLDPKSVLLECKAQSINKNESQKFKKQKEALRKGVPNKSGSDIFGTPNQQESKLKVNENKNSIVNYFNKQNSLFEVSQDSLQKEESIFKSSLKQEGNSNSLNSIFKTSPNQVGNSLFKSPKKKVENSIFNNSSNSISKSSSAQNESFIFKDSSAQKGSSIFKNSSSQKGSPLFKDSPAQKESSLFKHSPGQNRISIFKQVPLSNNNSSEKVDKHEVLQDKTLDLNKEKAKTDSNSHQISNSNSKQSKIKIIDKSSIKKFLDDSSEEKPTSTNNKPLSDSKITLLSDKLKSLQISESAEKVSSKPEGTNEESASNSSGDLKTSSFKFNFSKTVRKDSKSSDDLVIITNGSESSGDDISSSEGSVSL